MKSKLIKLVLEEYLKALDNQIEILCTQEGFYNPQKHPNIKTSSRFHNLQYTSSRGYLNPTNQYSSIPSTVRLQLRNDRNDIKTSP